VTNSNGNFNSDVLYFIGFADCVLNHDALFGDLVDAGYRVISYDYPGHGASSGSINDYTIPQLGQIGVQVFNIYGDAGRKMNIVGWSTGGLAAVRLIQGGVDGLQSAVLHAPGVQVQPLVGVAGFVTAGTLTNNPSANVCPIKPLTPLASPLFAASLLANAASSWIHSASGARILVVAAGLTEDKYVSTSGVMNWTTFQCSGVSDCTVFGIECPGAKHELDNEPSPVGDYVRAATVGFLNGQDSGNWGTGCNFFEPSSMLD